MERSRITVLPALRGAVGLVAPLAVGVATGQNATGVAVAVGVYNVALSDASDPYRHRAERLLIAALASAVSVFAGAATGANGVLAVFLVAIWGFAGGLLGAVRPAATMIVVPSISLLLIFSGTPTTLAQAAVEAAFVLGGGLVYAAFAVAVWPVRPYGPQRSALSALFRSLAAGARRKLPAAGGPVSTVEVTTAGEALAGMPNDGDEPEQLQILFDQAERLRLELSALSTIHQQLAANDPARAQVHLVLEATTRVLDDTASALIARAHASDPGQSLCRLEAAVLDLENLTGGNSQIVAMQKHATALAGQLRTVAALMAGDAPRLRGARIPSASASSSLLERSRRVLADVRGHLHMDSAVTRHAVRLAASMVVADLVGRVLGVPRFYWMPMTVAIVLRPDFSTTYARGIGRVAGTSLGVAFATLLMLGVGAHEWISVAAAGALAFVSLSTAGASVLVSAVAVTGLVVVLLSMAGYEADATILDRLLNTIAGGVIALISYWLWPTWEQAQIAALLADMLDAYRRYFQAVMHALVDASSASMESIASTRRAARAARIEAEVSVTRLRAEPELAADGCGLSVEAAEGILANSHRFVRNAMALEAEIYQNSACAPSAEAVQFVAGVDTTLRGLIAALRDPSHVPTGDLPDIRAEERHMARRAESMDGELARLAHFADPIVNSLTTMVALLEFDRARSTVRTATYGPSAQAAGARPCEDIANGPDEDHRHSCADRHDGPKAQYERSPDQGTQAQRRDR